VAAANVSSSLCGASLSALQMELPPFALGIEEPTCREPGVTVLADSPLGQGSLTGQTRSPDDSEEGAFRRRPLFYSQETSDHMLTMGLHKVERLYNGAASIS